MPNYIVYHSVSGEILRTGYCPKEFLNLQRQNSVEVVIEGQASDVKERINLLTQTKEKRGEK